MDKPREARMYTIRDDGKLYRLVLIPPKTGEMPVTIALCDEHRNWPPHILWARCPETGDLPFSSKGEIGPIPLAAGVRYVLEFELEEGFRSLEIQVGGYSYRSFPWPVVRSSTADFVRSFLRPSFHVLRPRKGHWAIEAEIEVTNGQLASYIDRGLAHHEVSLKNLENGAMFTFASPSSVFKFDVPERRIFRRGEFIPNAGRFKISSSIIADAVIDGYKDADFHEDYGQTTFRIEKGGPLALDERTYSLFPSADPPILGELVYECWPDGRLAKDEFYDEIIPAFVERRNFSSRHFYPHRFTVIAQGSETLLQFEVVAGAQSIDCRSRLIVTLAAWDGERKMLRYLPGAKKAGFIHELLRYDLFVMNGDPLIRIVSSLMGYLNAGEWSLSLGAVAYDKKGGNEVVLMPELPNSHWEYESDYPYILDFERRRILRPDVLSLFLEASSIEDMQGFLAILKNMGTQVPDRLVEECARKKLETGLERWRGQENQ